MYFQMATDSIIIMKIAAAGKQPRVGRGRGGAAACGKMANDSFLVDCAEAHNKGGGGEKGEAVHVITHTSRCQSA